MSLSICYCGTQAGYPHRDECPYPLYRGTDLDGYRWEEARVARAEARARVIEGARYCPGCWAELEPSNTGKVCGYGCEAA